MTESAHERTFVGTRTCIESRVKLECEKEQQEQLLLSVIPAYIAAEVSYFSFIIFKWYNILMLHYLLEDIADYSVLADLLFFFYRRLLVGSIFKLVCTKKCAIILSLKTAKCRTNCKHWDKIWTSYSMLGLICLTRNLMDQSWRPKNLLFYTRTISSYYNTRCCNFYMF